MSKKGLKGVLAIALSGTMAVGGMGFVLKNIINKNEMPKIENESGYSNICPIPIFNWNVDEEDFVILNIGDHNTVKTSFQNEKMRFCNENNISLGAIISTNADNEADIYNDVEYAKGIVRDYKIDFPIYLNINNIITNTGLNIEMQTKLIKDFLEKCSANNIYVGLYGTDTNLCRVKEYCKITGYDALVVMDKEDISYDGEYLVYQDLDGKFKAKEDISKAITKKSLNNSSKFARDGAYTVSEDDDLIDIALRYGMSVNEILEFNNLYKSEIEAGTTLRIPSVIDTNNPSDNLFYKTLDTPIRGCDMSYAQGTSIDWDFMSENYEFMILRCSIGKSADDRFEENAAKANLNNIPLGVYCYNAYTMTDCNDDIEDFKKKQQEQADYAISLLKNKKIDYPVYLDIEGNIESSLNKESVKEMLKIWQTKITEAGYIPGVYCNQSGFRFLQSKLDYNISDNFEVWIAGGDQYGNEDNSKDNIDFENVVPSYVLDNKEFNASMAQSTNVAINAGAADGRGHLDIDFSKVDYTQKSVTESADESLFAIKEFNRVDAELIGLCAAAGSGLVALAGVGFAALKRKKDKARQRPQVKTRTR